MQCGVLAECPLHHQLPPSMLMCGCWPDLFTPIQGCSNNWIGLRSAHAIAQVAHEDSQLAVTKQGGAR